MAAGVRFMKKLVRRKVFTDDDVEATDLHRCLTTFDIIGLGIGSTLGTGIYIVTGQVAKETAGPAVILSFLIAGVASAFAGMCYAEFAARVPRAGSAYVYSYVTVGELMAFVIGWNLLLEYIIGTASVARAWSTNFDALIDYQIRNFFQQHMPMSVDGFSGYPDFFAFGLTLVLTGILAIGVKESTRFNNIFTGVNLFVITYVIICGFFKADLSNWSIPESELPPSGAGSGGFFPFGFSGVMSGAATCFYAYVGFDCVATTGEETQNPQRAIPVGIAVSLAVISLSYCGVSAVVTLACPYFLLDTGAPLPFIFQRVGWGVARYVIAVGSLCGLSTSLMGAMFPLPRILYAMGSDGLIFRWLATVSPRFKTPLVGTMVSGIFAGFMAMIFNLSELVDMMSIGTLLAYTLVAVCVLILRYEVDEKLPSAASQASLSRSSLMERADPFRLSDLLRPHSLTPTRVSAHVAKVAVGLLCLLLLALCAVVIFLNGQLLSGRWWAVLLTACLGTAVLAVGVVLLRQPQSDATLVFKVPLVPFIPTLSVLVNVFLMLKLSSMTWLRFGVWMLIGFSVYFLYGVWHSRLHSGPDYQPLEESTPCTKPRTHPGPKANGGNCPPAPVEQESKH